MVEYDCTKSEGFSDSTDLIQEKERLRKQVLKRLREQQEADRKRLSLAIQKKLQALECYRNARTILFYASFGGEVDTYQMMRDARAEAKTIALPVIDRKNNEIRPAVVSDPSTGLVIGPYGIAQPDPQQAQWLSVDEIDVCLVPGVAFDREGRRLGRGGGYYDRLLSRLGGRTARIGLAFSFQIVDRIPTAPHDQVVDTVITD